MPKPLIYILNGPNLNLLGKRQPELYGSRPLEEVLEQLRQDNVEREFVCHQSNHEGHLIDWLQEAAREGACGVVLNAGGYSHTSVALRDAIAAIDVPVVEVHISNIYSREPFRAHSLLSPVAAGVICGLGTVGYQLAVDAIQHKINS